MEFQHQRHPLQLALRVAGLLAGRDHYTDALVQRSYDRLSQGYDNAWTHHMRDRTEQLINRLDIQPGRSAVDLTCGTGYATSLLAHKAGTRVVGVDRSGGMLEVARQHHGHCCDFVQADILEFLERYPADSVDVLTCCWGLGYSRPLAVLKQIRRVVRPGGLVGIIDNSLFSLAEVLWCSLLAFLEQPRHLAHIMHFRFLTGPKQLKLWFKLAGLEPQTLWSGQKTYVVETGAQAIARLRATGAAAGFEYAADDAASDAVFERFAELIEQKYRQRGIIPITHRYLAGIARV